MARAMHTWRFALVTTAFILLQPKPADATHGIYCSNINTSYGSRPANVSGLMSVGSCHVTCSDEAQYAFSITQGQKCWCSNIAPADTEPLYECNTLCPGYPVSEYCGSVSGNLFSYLGLGPKAEGTSGLPTPQSLTHTTAVTRTVTKTSVNTVSGNGKTTTSEQTIVRTSIKTVLTVTTPSSAVTDTESLVPTVSTSLITLRYTTSTERITSYVTAPSAPGSKPQVVETHSGISGGAIAGIVIGAVLALAILAAIVYFCCWRPRSRNNGGRDNSGLGRNTSVLSKSGLIPQSTGPQAMSTTTTATAAAIAAAATTSSSYAGSGRPPRIQTDIPPVSSVAPSSAATGGTMGSSRRDSRPLFVDQRLNPNALTVHENPSQTSISTLHDEHDYSRPLEVRNPDPPLRLL